MHMGEGRREKKGGRDGGVVTDRGGEVQSSRGAKKKLCRLHFQFSKSETADRTALLFSGLRGGGTGSPEKKERRNRKRKGCEASDNFPATGCRAARGAHILNSALVQAPFSVKGVTAEGGTEANKVQR